MNRRGRRRKEVNSHISLQTIKQYLLHAKYPNGCVPTDKRGIRKRCESFKLEGDILYYIARPKRLDDEPIDPNPADDRHNYRKAILTNREQLAVTARAHIGESGIHKGTERTLREVSSQYYWVGMSATARQVVKSCTFCLARQDTGGYDPGVPPNTATIASSNDITNIIIQPRPNETTVTQEESSIIEDLNSKLESENVPVPAEANEPFTVTEEVENPVEEDPGLDFDVGAIFSDGKNLMEECELLKAQRFWERVEILLLSPTVESKKKKEDGRGRHKNHIIVALDSFSKWPEAKKLDKVNEQTISQFIIQLISRFGVMDQLVILENDMFIEQSLVIYGITQNLSMFNVSVMSESYNPYDENWPRISMCLSQFVQSYPSSWSSCIDLCLMPLRNSIAPKTDYTPAYVVTGREPVFPGFLIPHRQSLSSVETVFNHEQIKMASNDLMSKYQECCEADVKQVITPLDSIPVKLTSYSNSMKEESVGVRRSGRKVTVSHRLADYDHVIPPSTGQPEGDKDCDNVDVDDSIYSDKEDATQSIPLKKRKHTDFTNCDEDEVSRFDVIVLGSKKHDGEDALNKLDTCTYYKILKLYIEKGEYPLNSSMPFKRIIRKAKDIYSMEDGQLMYNYKNKTKKRVLTTLKERLELLDEIHTSTEDHVPRNKMIDLLDQRLVYWKCCSRDVDAYVKACPGCKHGKVRSRVKKKTGKKWQVDECSDDEDDWNCCEKYQDKVSSFYPDLIEYLNSGTGPSHLSRSELVVFKKKAKNFKLVKGELLYFTSSTATKIKGRKVLANEDQRKEVMRIAHGDTHQPPSVMLAEIRKHYYWRPQSKDVENFVQNCCHSEVETRKDKADDLSLKIELFARHFKGENICTGMTIDLDSLFTGTDTINTEVDKSESLNDQTGQFQGTLQQKLENVSDNAASEPSCIATNTDESLSNQQMVTTVSKSDDNVATNELEQGASSIPTITVKQKAEGEDAENIQELKMETNEADQSSQPVHEMNEEEDEEGEVSDMGDQKAFVQHLKTKKKQGEKMRCEICRKIVRGENNMKEHMYKHNGIKPFSCEVCNKKLTTVKGMRMHMRKHTGHRPYLCNVCGRGFPRSASLRYHIKTHNKSSTVPIICDICDRVFTSENRMRKHKLFKHPEKRPVWRCDACGKHFTAKRSLKRHEEAHQDIRRYVCTFCNRSFFRKEYLTYHMDSHYKGNPSMAHLATKRKRRLATQRQQSTKEDNTNILSIYTVEPNTGQEKLYTQLVEVANPHGWTEAVNEVPTVFTLEGRTLHVSEGGTLQVGEGGTLQVTKVVDQSDTGTALMMVENSAGAATAETSHSQDMKLSHIIMSTDVNSQQTVADPNQLQISLPPVQEPVQLTQDELTLATTSSTISAPTTHIIQTIENTANEHQIQQHDIVVQEVETELAQEEHMDHDGHQTELQQQQPDTILTTITTPGASSNAEGSIVIPAESGSIINAAGGRQIELRMSNGQKLMLSRTNDVGVASSEGDGEVGQGEEMVQYRLECLDGETITEEHLNAFRMLAQASTLLQP